MTDYVKLTNYASKDLLLSGDPLKRLSGTEIDADFLAIQTAVASKLDRASPTMTGTPTTPTPSVDNSSTQVVNSQWVRDLIVANKATDLATLPAFKVNNSVEQTSGFDIVYGSKQFDNSNSFNLATGSFTAPVAGIYHFSGQWRAYNTNAFDVLLVVAFFVTSTLTVPNTFELARTENLLRAGNINGTALSMTLKLAAGDVVKTAAPGVAWSSLTTLQTATFSGHLVR